VNIMPPRNPELPEGTDQVIAGASTEGGQDSGGFVARRDDGAGTTDRLVTQAREQIVTLKGQAGEKLRAYADDGKGRASNLLEEFGGVLSDAARSVDERMGSQYGEYAHRAAGAVSEFAGKVREKNVDDFVDDAKEFVRKSPVIAIGIAAVAGFALVRVLRTGLDDVTGGRSRRDRDQG
jgi:ElaB/YqjD/DUF883 family membrane-anchored ribosome-binding protein